MLDRLIEIEKNYEELTAQISSPEIMSDMSIYAKTMKQHRSLEEIVVKYRDVKYAIPFGIQLWLFLTPVIYPTSVFPETFRWVLAFNPMTGLIEAFRFAIVPTQLMNWNLLWISLLSTAFVFVFGVIYFKRTERAFADIV